MSDTITYDPFGGRRTAADTSVKILALLSDGLFRNKNQIQNKLVVEWNKASFQKHLDTMKSDGLLEHWDDLPEDVQKKYKKNHPTFESKGSKHIYKITERGREKFNKIKYQCLDDPIIQRILRARVEEPNN